MKYFFFGISSNLDWSTAIRNDSVLLINNTDNSGDNTKFILDILLAVYRIDRSREVRQFLQ
jgi:hypothetical protein